MALAISYTYRITFEIMTDLINKILRELVYFCTGVKEKINCRLKFVRI